jgi:pimeloyl-ACP methyl ester carboxylesterase
VTVVFVHGIPETREIWSPLQEDLRRNAVALALPGFGSPRPEAFTGTKDAYAQWLAEELAGIGQPVDVVGHDIGALLTLRVSSALDIPLRSWAVDVANIFHPSFEWPERVHKLQTPGLGEDRGDSCSSCPILQKTKRCRWRWPSGWGRRPRASMT